MYNVRFLASFILLLLGALLRLSNVFFQMNRRAVHCVCVIFFSSHFFLFFQLWVSVLLMHVARSRLVLDCGFSLVYTPYTYIRLLLRVLHCFCDFMLSLLRCGCGSLYFFISRNCLSLYNHSLSPIWRATLAGMITLKVILNVSHNAHTHTHATKTTVVHSISERAKKNAFAWFAL